MLFPHETFVVFPFVPTLIGQYILKNVVLISGVIVLAFEVRPGSIVLEEPLRKAA